MVLSHFCISGLPKDKKDYFQNARTEIAYQKTGEDQWVIDVGVQGESKTRKFCFKLGEPYDSESIDGSPLKVSFCLCCLYEICVHKPGQSIGSSFGFFFFFFVAVCLSRAVFICLSLPLCDPF